MKALNALAAMTACLLLGVPSRADHPERPCSTRSLAGHWIFATEVGQFPAFGGDITALGTMNIDRDGKLSGRFDATVSSVTFLADVTYTGSVTVDRSCRGTLLFQTSAGTTRTDSVAVVGDGEMWGMSQDPGNLWTYRVKRISRRLPVSE